MADGLNGQENEPKRLLGVVKAQQQEKRDLWLRNEGHFFAYRDFYRESDQLNKELEVLMTSPNSDPWEVECKDVEVKAITKMSSKAGATTDLEQLKEDLDSLLPGTADKVEDTEDVETLLIIADTLRKKRKRQREEGVHHPNPKKSTNQDPPKIGAH
ncbi:hypothetical protein L7F22_057043 [Adiantum nelumboides]|nr:hypothetical protein [Adiantum nelumboides]